MTPNLPVKRESLNKAFERVPQSFFLLVTSPEEVYTVIENLNDTGLGLDNFNPSYIVNCASIVSLAFAHIVNFRIKTAVFLSVIKKTPS